MEENDIWDKAPVGATHYSPEGECVPPVYRKILNGIVDTVWIEPLHEVLREGWTLDQGYHRYDYEYLWKPKVDTTDMVERPTLSPIVGEGMDAIDKGGEMKTYLKNLDLVFGSSTFSGGRLDKKGDGIVEVCFQAMGEEVNIVLFDNMSKEDGHYSPVCLTKEQAETLRDWLTYKIEEM